MVRNKLDGMRFGRYVVLKFAGKDKGNNAKWLCRCDCGKEKTVLGTLLKNGSTKSCGCLKKELHSCWNITHGQSRKTTYRIWDGMIRRCSDPKNPQYKYYGGKGINVCNKWKKFSGFFEDMGVRPPGLTLERKDSHGNYEKANCIWATYTTNLRNRPGYIKLSIEKAQEIRKLLQEGALSQRKIAKMYNVPHSIIGKIKNNEIWKQ